LRTASLIRARFALPTALVVMGSKRSSTSTAAGQWRTGTVLRGRAGMRSGFPSGRSKTRDQHGSCL
jgi:hypothetical protein